MQCAAASVARVSAIPCGRANVDLRGLTGVPPAPLPHATITPRSWLLLFFLLDPSYPYFLWWTRTAA